MVGYREEHITMYFEHCTSLDELRAEYRILIKINHPDVGGDAETMKVINNEYDFRFDELKRGTPHARTNSTI